MAKNQYGVYISDDSRTWIERFAPVDTKSGSVGFAADWAIQQFKRGALQAYQALDQEERVAVIASLNGFVPDTRMASIAMHVLDWVELDSGMMLEWDKDKIDILVAKLKDFTPTQTMGLVCWGLGFWRPKELENIEAYAEDHTRLV